MSRIRLVAIGAVLLFALTANAQHGYHRSGAQNGVPTAEEQLKLFTATLNLSRDQQAKIKPILNDLHNATEKLVRDQGLSHEQRMSQVRAWRLKTDRRIREVLNDQQKKELDQVEHEPHPELHGSVK